MYKIILIIGSIVSCASFAMESQQPNQARTLREMCKIAPQDLKVRMLLPGDERAQREVVHDFLGKCSDIIESPEGINVTQLRAVCKKVVHALARKDSTGDDTGRMVRARELLKKPLETAEQGTLTTVTINNEGVHVQSESPVLSRGAQTGVPFVQVTHIRTLNPTTELTRLEALLSGKGRWVKIGALGSSVFVAGMVVGWFYTTKAHHSNNSVQ